MALERTGFSPQRVETVFGDQYVWAEAVATSMHSDTHDGRDSFAAMWRQEIARLASSRSVAVWGAGAKGATFLHIVDPDAELVCCVVDINPAKQGSYIPATGHRVVSPAEAAQAGVGTVVLMNPNYASEVAALIDELEWQTQLIVLDREPRRAAC
jgi:hypothetical protein